jgi:hypothetical protein
MRHTTREISPDASPFQKCLTVAERILRALDDPSVYERYMRIKEQMVHTRAKSFSPVHSPQARQIILENRNLALRLQEMQAELANERQLEQWLLTQLEVLQHQILPESSLPPLRSLEDATTAILQTIETRVTTHQFLRDRLTEEGRQLQEAIQKLKQRTLDQIDGSRQSRVGLNASWQRTQIEANQAMAAKAQLIERAPHDLGKVRQGRVKLEREIGQLPEVAEIELRKEEAEERLNQAEAKRDCLRQELRSLNFQRRRIGNEIEELRRIEGLGLSLGAQRIDGRAEASRLESEITELQLQNSSLVAQIAQGRASHAEEEEEEEELGA